MSLAAVCPLCLPYGLCFVRFYVPDGWVCVGLHGDFAVHQLRHELPSLRPVGARTAVRTTQPRTRL